MSKKLTPTVARILAQKVQEKLRSHAKQHETALKLTVEASKEYKEYLKLVAQYRKLDAEIEAIEYKLQEKFSTSLARVQINNYSSGISISIREASSVCVDSIKDAILLEDYFAGSTQTPDELVDTIVKKYTA